MCAGMSSVEMQNCMFHTSLVGVNSHVFSVLVVLVIHAARIILIIMLSEFDSCLGMSMHM